MCPVSRAEPQHIRQVVPADGALAVPAFALHPVQRRPAGVWPELLRVLACVLYIKPNFIHRRDF